MVSLTGPNPVNSDVMRQIKVALSSAHLTGKG